MANALSLLVRIGADNRELTRTLKHTEKQLTTLTRSVRGVAKAFVGAFAINEIRQFGQASVREFMAAETAMNRLSGSLKNAGVEMGRVRGEIERVAGALEDATAFGDDELVAALQTVVRISNDYKGSLAELETVANLASGAQIDLETAATLVGKAMVGNTGTLARYGIVVKEGTDAMQALRDRFKGMATQEAATLEGRVKQLNNEWGNFKEALGGVIVGGNSAGQSVSTLRDHIRNLTSWIEEHKGELAAFRNDLVEIASVAANPIKITIQFIGDSLSLLARTIRELREFQEQSSARMVMLGREGGGEIFGGRGAGRTWSAVTTGGGGGGGGTGGDLGGTVTAAVDNLLAKQLASYKDSAMGRKDVRRERLGRLFGQLPSGAVVAGGSDTGPRGGGMLNAGGVAVAPNGAGGGGGGGMLGGLMGSIGGMLQSFVTIGAVGQVVASAFSAMKPALDVLRMPLEALGKLVGGVLNKALSYLAEGIGWLIRAIGKAVNFLLPGNPANGLVKFGQEMMDSAKAARKATDATEKFAESLSNIPRVINLAALRNRIGAGPGAPGGGGGGGGNPGGPGGGGGDPAFPLSIGTVNVYGVQDPEQFLDKLGRIAQTRTGRGGTSMLHLAMRGA